MKIWIDGYEANVLQRLGSSQVAFELIRHFEKIDKENDYTILLPGSPLDDLPAGEAGLPKERSGWKYKVLKPKRLWTRIALPLALFTARQKPDLFFSPTHYIPRFSPVKRVVTIFDLSFLHFPEMFIQKDLWQLKNWTKFSIENADHIITISNFSKQDIISQYKIDKNKITIAYPGYDSAKFKMQSVKSKKDYIIYIGTIQPRKNLIRLMEAVARIDGLKLIIVGKTGWEYEEILDTPKKLGIEDRVEFKGYVATDKLVGLLAGASAFVLPSLWEGFGIPVVEAMACGTPVIVSNVSSLPEVVGEAGILVDPYSVDQIEQAIRLLMTDQKLRQKYSKLGLAQAQKFSWEKMAKQVLKVFEKVANP